MTNYHKIESAILKIAFAAAIVCSTAYLLMLGWYNNLLLDDYGFVVEVDNSGAFGLMHSAYFGWQCRFSGFYVLGWILKLWGHASNLVGYTIMMLLLGYAAIYYALRNLTTIMKYWTLIGIAMLFVNISIMAYFELSTFYWMCCALYTLSTYAAIVMLTAIFFSKGKSLLRWILVIICSLYISGGAENFTPVVMAILGIVLLYQLIRDHDWRFWRTEQQQMILVSLLIMGAGFIAVIAGPGTRVRAIDGHMHGFMEHFALIPYFAKFTKASAIFLMRLLSRSLYYVLLLPFGIWIGAQMRKNGFKPNVSISAAVVWSLLAVAGIIAISIAAPVYGMGWYSPLRSYSFISFVMAALVLYWGALIGAHFDRERLRQWSVIGACVIIAGMSVYFFQWEQPMVADVRNQIESRQTQILAHQEAGLLEPLVMEEVHYPYIPNTYAVLRRMVNKITDKKNSEIAPPATYFPYERYCLTRDPHDWRNTGVQGWAHADFDIIGWADSE